MDRRLLAAFLVSAATLAPAVPAGALDGARDTAGYFTGYGYRIVGSTTTSGASGVVDADGNAVFVGKQGAATLYWARYDGTAGAAPPPDPACSFTPAGASSISPADALLDGSGRLVIVGTVSYPGAGQLLFAARYNYPACNLDATFDDDGYFTLDHADDLVALRVARVTVLSFGFFVERLVIAGNVNYSGSDLSDFLLVRLTGGGSLDANFSPGGADGDGVAIYDFDGQSNFLFDMTIDRQKRIVLVGSVDLFGDDPDAMIVRTLSNGTLDDDFGSFGWRRFDLSQSSSGEDYAGAVSIAEDGRIFVSGVAFIPSGLPGTALCTAHLGTDGLGTIAPKHQVTYAVGTQITVEDSVLQGDGRLLVVGRSDYADGDYDGAVTALRTENVPPSYSTDATWGDGSTGDPQTYYELDLGGDDDEDFDKVVLHQGRPYLFGDVDTASGARGLVMRLTNSYIFADGFGAGSTAAW